VDTMTPLVGREQEMDVIGGFVGRARVAGGALLLTGEPGVGKSRLLHEARAAAAGDHLVLTAGGAEFETNIQFAALNQALRPVFGEVRHLRGEHRRALSAALGFTPDRERDVHRVTDALFDLLRRLTRSRPLLLSIDDLQWVDGSSIAVLGLLAEKLSDLPVGLIAAAQDDDPGRIDGLRCSRLVVRPVDDAITAGLIREGAPGLHTRTVRRVVDLPERTRELLLSMALTTDADHVLPIAPGGTGALLDLRPAESANLVTFDPATQRFAFCHPVIRSTIVTLSTSEQRRAAHARLASVTSEPAIRAWHLAETTLAPDEDVAVLLEQVARTAISAGDATEAVHALQRSADLSQRSGSRARRLLESAYLAATATGALHDVPGLIAAAQEVDPHVTGSIAGTSGRAHLALHSHGNVESAHGLLTAGLETQLAGGPAGSSEVAEALELLLEVCLVGGRVELWKPLRAELMRWGATGSSALRLQRQLRGDPARAKDSDLTLLDDLIDRVDESSNPVEVVRLAATALCVDRLDHCQESLVRVIDDGRRGGAVAAAISGLAVLAQADFTAGRWDEAEQHAAEGLSLAAPRGYRLNAVECRLNQAIVDAARGRTEEVIAATADMHPWAVARGARSIAHACHRAQSLVALGQGDFETAYRHSTEISPAGRLAAYAPTALQVATDLVESAMRTNRREQAQAHVRAMIASGIARLSPRLALCVEMSAGMIAADRDARQHFERALAVAGAERYPFDLARAQLLYGERLRRMRSPAQARTHLTAAMRVFERLSAPDWAERARTELGATGLTKQRGGACGVSALTPQEREVALLAASGLSNKAIGDRLFLSHRTVGAHLRNVFLKLAIQNRASLRDALNADRVVA
jgi:DNA-binding CsgD family transcriptional regulator